MTEKLESASADLERLREEKDEEIMILQEGVDSTLQKMADIQAVMLFTYEESVSFTDYCIDPRNCRANHRCSTINTHSGQPQEAQCYYW